MENEKPNHWRFKNAEYAAVHVLYQVRGYLKASKGPVEPKDLLDYINRALVEETERLDEKFPEKKTRPRE